jgi:hypothetical protein
MKAANISLVLTICVFIFGCAFGAKMENMAYQGDKKTYDERLKNNVGIVSVYGGERTTPVGPPAISNEEFSRAVKKSLSEQDLLSENGKFQLEILIADNNRPSFGADMTVTTYVQYVLTDTNTNSMIFDEIIFTSYTVALDDAFAGTKRIRLANEGSGKMNIEKFLEKLSELTISPKDISNVQ